MDMNLYSYNGPVLVFNTIVASNWRGQTMATSEKKARSNLSYQFKKATNRVASSKVTLPGKIILECWKEKVWKKNTSLTLERAKKKKKT